MNVFTSLAIPSGAFIGLLLFSFIGRASLHAQSADPLKVAVVGLSHDHVHWILGRADRGDLEIVGYVEDNPVVIERLSRQYKLDKTDMYADLASLLKEQSPEAITHFGPIDQHLQAVLTCAPLGIHVMVEKPLAVNLDHAQQMVEAARKGNIHLLTNYETTWYGANHHIYKMVHQDSSLGEIRKLVVHDGHKGPIEIGCSREFTDWLTDPVQNGGGALTDFGCYGANLMTWLMKGERPLAVTAVTQQIKPDIYGKVEDEATIIVRYPKAQGIIQASWNWPFNRKDTHVYGTGGYVKAVDGTHLQIRLSEQEGESNLEVGSMKAPLDDPFAMLAAVVKGDMDPTGSLSSLDVNLVVMEILDAARRSAESGKTIILE